MMKWIHNKTGNIYQELHRAIDTTNTRSGDQVVVYQNERGQVFVRDCDEFEAKFTRHEVYQCQTQ